MKVRIDEHGLFTLILLLEIGSTTLFALGIDSNQDAWIAIIIAALIGILLLWIYIKLQVFFPDKNYAEIIIEVLGTTIGTPFVIVNALYFLHISTHNLNEFSNIVSITLLDKTPRIIIFLIFISVSIFALYLGIEAFVNTGKMMIKILMFFLLITYFLMFWCFVEPKDKIRKVSYMALLTSSILLCFSLIIIVSVLGVTIASNSLIPLLDVVKQINILGILRNFDAIAILNMLIGGFFKFTIFFYAGVSCFSTLFKLKDYRRILIPVGLVTLYVSFYTMPNILVQKWVGPEITAKYINIPLQIAIPSSLLIISMLKNYKVNKTKQSHTN
ncbi:GerAB/ArcD/ProY family transporter [Clostridium grantii]|uniref:Spore germination protein KB n=1 Tax=Clostridium grantii DSM 8605 TaxID=1121316 RepID=A0A1M5QDT0_9CLOT|nr:GerAB/ArcD/ProY family transporter [Clostridium grantii]SHH11996.1 spore germination protein KB [Clostridium grantii DSM 8605]